MTWENSLKSYKVRITSSWAYSIDKYEKWEFIETISSNNLFNESNEEELNNFSNEIVEKNKVEWISDQKFLDELKWMYESKYWIISTDDWLEFEWDEDHSDETNNVWVQIPENLLNWYKTWFNTILEKDWSIIEDWKLKIWTYSYSHLSTKYFNKNIKDNFCIDCDNQWIITNYSKEDKRYFDEWLKKHFKENDEFKEYYFHWIIEWMFYSNWKIEDHVWISNSKKNFWLDDQEVLFPVLKDKLF